jgi:anti-sigma B factor antagonist
MLPDGPRRNAGTVAPNASSAPFGEYRPLVTLEPKRHPGRTSEGRLAEVARRDGVLVLALAGELDLYVASDLRRELDEALAARPASLVLDLGRVEFVDSTVLGLFLVASRRAAEAGGRVALACTQPEVWRTLAATGLEEHLASFPTVEEAFPS